MDTIAAIATPPGRGGIGIIRISGSEAKSLLGRIFLPHSSHFNNFIPWHLHHGGVLDQNGEILDDALAVYMPGPDTFTGEEVVELHCHGNPVILNALLNNIISLGARLAEKGEFSRRAFLHGRIDLSQAEAIAELIAAPSRKAVKLSYDRLEGALSMKTRELIRELEIARTLLMGGLDFPEEEFAIDEKNLTLVLKRAKAGLQAIDNYFHTANLYQKGAEIVLLGPVNAGKSTLLNALCGKDRALVSDIPGTTRDYLEETVNIDGLLCTFIDTAGLRKNANEIEARGIRKTRQKIEDADLLVLLLDCSRPDALIEREILDDALRARKNIVVVWNKNDLAQPPNVPEWLQGLPVCEISCATGNNLETLKKLLVKTLLSDQEIPDNAILPNLRQHLNISQALAELEEMLVKLEEKTPLDCLASHLDAAISCLARMLGLQTDEEILNNIFSTFCIGK